LRSAPGRWFVVVRELLQAGWLDGSVQQACRQCGLGQHDRVQVVGEPAEQVEDLVDQRVQQQPQDGALGGGLVREPVELVESGELLVNCSACSPPRSMPCRPARCSVVLAGLASG
jgi:hypothetical protein